MQESFTDRVSGGSRAERTSLSVMLRHLGRGETVRVASMDRLARSMIDLAHVVTELTRRGVRAESASERLAFDPGGDDPFALFQLQLLGAFAQLERSRIRQRQSEGIAFGRANGVYRRRARTPTANRSVRPPAWP